MAEVSLNIDLSEIYIEVHKHLKNCFMSLIEEAAEYDWSKEEWIGAIKEVVEELDQQIAVCQVQQLLNA